MSSLKRYAHAAILMIAAGFTGNVWAAGPAPGETTVWTFAPESTPSNLVWHNGVLYGVTGEGGTYSYGSVFQLTPPAKAGHAWTRTELYSFTGGSDGQSPAGTLAFDGSGAVYGVTASGCGAIFQLAPPAAGGSGWSFNIIYAPASGSRDCYPGQLVTGNDGSIYGLTTNSYGEVFQLVPPAPGGAWSVIVIHTFTGPDGDQPGTLVQDASGALYATVGFITGASCPSCGGVVQLTPPGAAGGTWGESVLYSFAGTADGAYPTSLATGAGGTVYGTTEGGGYPFVCIGGCGTVFELVPPAASGGAWTETVLYTPTTNAQSSPTNLAYAPSGALYGTAGGVTGISQAVFQLAPPAAGGGSWTPSTIYTPKTGFFEAFVLDSNGNPEGAIGQEVFQLQPTASGKTTWKRTPMYNFGVENDADYPEDVVFDAQGNMYGVAEYGGVDGQGAVFELTPPSAAGQPWKRTLLHSFTGKDGAQPTSLLLDANGTIYGTTLYGGPHTCNYNGETHGCGTVFRLTPPAKTGGNWKLTSLHVFAHNSSGFLPANLVIDPNGALYGYTSGGGVKNWGTIFELQPVVKGSWPLTTLYAFQGGTDGETPISLIYQNGLLYGATFGALSGGGYGGGSGHSVNNGTVFQLTPPATVGGAWTETVLHYFAGGADGTNPTSNILFDNNGAIYGATGGGGSGCTKPKYGCGTLFQLTPPAAAGGAWTENILYNFKGKADLPAISLVFNNGALLGCNGALGGTFGDNSLIQLTPGASGAPWSETMLYTFPGGTYQIPHGLVMNNGALYGVTVAGGTFSEGTVFEWGF
jgi:hypothetical protein